MAKSEPPPTKDNPALALENRRRIFDFIRRTPGAHLREVQRALGLPYGTAEYHLRALEEAELVRGTQDGSLKRFFAAEFAFGDRAVLGLMRKRPVRAVVLVLLGEGELTHQELAARAGIKAPTLSYHLPKLEGAGLVASRRDGRFTRVRLADPKLVTRLLIAHGRSFADGAVDRFLDTWSGFAVGAREESAVQGAGGGGGAPPPGGEGEAKEKEEGGAGPPKVDQA